MDSFRLRGGKGFLAGVFRRVSVEGARKAETLNLKSQDAFDHDKGQKSAISGKISPPDVVLNFSTGFFLSV